MPDRSTIMYTMKVNYIKCIVDEYFYYSIYRNSDGKLMLCTPDKKWAEERLDVLKKSGPETGSMND